MKTGDKERIKYQRALILILLIIISFLLHIIIFETFLKCSFRTHAHRFIKNISSYLNPSEQKALDEQSIQKHAAIKRILESTKKSHDQKKTLLKKLLNSRPAKLVAPKSNFGWVIFDTQQQPKTLEIPHTKQGEVGMAKSTHATETKPQIKINTTTTDKTIEQDAQATKKPTFTPTRENNVANADSKIDIKVEKKVELAEPTQTKPIENIKQKIEAIETLQNKIATYSENQTQPQQQKTTLPPPQEEHEMTKEEEKNMILNSMLRKDITKSTDQDRQNQPNTEFVWGVGNNKKCDKNLIKLTKGYIEKLRGESGTDQIDRDGDPNKRPSFEELKYISYESKINWCLQASWKDNFAHSQVLHFNEGKAVIEFTIDEKGKLLSTKMLQSSGYHEVDSAIMKNFEFASPFPPLPKHFGTKAYTTGRIITVYAQKFGL